VAAVDVEDVPCHEFGFVRSQEDDTFSDLFGKTKGASGTCVTGTALLSAVPVKRVSMPVQAPQDATWTAANCSQRR
jgi:hypothetical protein